MSAPPGGARATESWTSWTGGADLGGPPEEREFLLYFGRPLLLNYEGKPDEAYLALEQALPRVEAKDRLAREWLFTLIYFQGVTALRRGETDNCVRCLGEGACILPIAPTARHTQPGGSRQAIRHFTEYLNKFPDDLEVRWLLNVAHMTLGEHPQRVDPKYVISLDRFNEAEFDLGKFRDVASRAGVDRLNMAGGAIMDDFDDDGRLDLVATTWDASESIAFYRNRGDGTFEDRSAAAGLGGQYGGLNCVQADYDNDGHLDVFVSRGAWWPWPVSPSLSAQQRRRDLHRRHGEGRAPGSGQLNRAAWADYDNDGWLDLFVCCELQPNRLYQNKGGTFEEVAARAGRGRQRTSTARVPPGSTTTTTATRTCS